MPMTRTEGRTDGKVEILMYMPPKKVLIYSQTNKSLANIGGKYPTVLSKGEQTSTTTTTNNNSTGKSFLLPRSAFVSSMCNLMHAIA